MTEQPAPKKKTNQGCAIAALVGIVIVALLNWIGGDDATGWDQATAEGITISRADYDALCRTAAGSRMPWDDVEARWSTEDANRLTSIITSDPDCQ